ncbi:hypothetical protein [Mucilaginibacter celer]|uniref:Uncharacterized protein n=1 Tax=Mucilaginibacter celer TaxID=2305508 RepID=A0A494VRA0_9SPHI|nr:hypothetical protein [Mucilaginibacter celer]AYL96561.1 hypothetical protein HYN43_015190 [Mucilaginibacter celer]
MSTKRKMIMVVNHVLQQDEDRLDTEFWLKKTPSERLAEVSRLRRLYFSTAEKPFPEKIEKVVFRRKLR